MYISARRTYRINISILIYLIDTILSTSVTIVSGIKPKLITIKEGKDSETKIKGFIYTFKVEGDPDLIEIGYKSGFGQANAMGFGFVEAL